MTYCSNDSNLVVGEYVGDSKYGIFLNAISKYGVYTKACHKFKDMLELYRKEPEEVIKSSSIFKTHVREGMW